MIYRIVWENVIVLALFILLAWLVGCSQQQPKQYDREWRHHEQAYYQLMGWETQKPRKIIFCAFGGSSEAETYYCALKNFGEEGVDFLQERKNICKICSSQKLTTVEEWKLCVELCRP